MALLTFIWNNLFAFLFVLSVIVFVHEMGHFLVARFYGIKVKVFSVGFGPELLGYTGKSGTRYRISLLPLGGYVSMYGEQLHSNENDSQFSFAARPPYARAAVVFAGPLANFILALVIMSLFFALQGVEKSQLQGVKIGDVMAQSPASQAGLQPDDIITRIDGNDIRSFALVANLVQQSQGQIMQLTIKRGETLLQLPIIAQMRLSEQGQNIFYIGITASAPEFVQINPVQATFLAGKNLLWMSGENLKALAEIVIGKRSTDDLGGPVRIAAISQDFAKSGFLNLLFFMAILSMNLGLINLFPIPVLDGGHLVFIFYEMVRGKPLPLLWRERCQQMGFMLLIMLIIFVTTNDILLLS